MTGGTADSTRGESRERTGDWQRPSRRTVLGGLGGVAAGSLTIGSVGATLGSTGPATPTVEGPVEGGSQTGRPLTAAPHDFESAGYVEEEYFVSGEAEPMSTGGLYGDLGVGGRFSDEGPAEYKTRILVYRPENEEDFNGGVLVEWLNVSLQTDFPVAWPNAYDYLQRNGWAVALVSAQKVGVDDSAQNWDLVSWDPERYGDLHHPGDEYALDIFAQAIQALRRDGGDSTTAGSGGWFGSGAGSRSRGSSGGWWGRGTSGGGTDGTGGGGDDPHPLAGMDAEFVVATGQSQSSGYINGFINEVEPSYDVVDGFLPAAGVPINLSTDVKPTIWLNTMSEAAGGSLVDPEQGGGAGDVPISEITSGNRSLEEVDVDPIVLARLTDIDFPVDEKLFRFWEVAGAVHVNQWLSFWAGAARRRDFGTDDPPWDPQMAANYGEQEEGQYGVCQFNYFPHRYTFPAALEALKDWILEGEPAPSAPRMERTETEGGETTLATDEYGNVRGGVRLPPIEAPVATYEDSCQQLTGKTVRFDQDRLDSLYPSHDEYVSQFEAAAQRAVEDGFLLEADAEELVARAEASPIGR